MKDIKHFILESINDKRHIAVDKYMANHWSVSIDGQTKFFINKDGFIFRPDEKHFQKSNSINGSKDENDLAVYHCCNDDDAVLVSKAINKEIGNDKVHWDMFRQINKK